MKKVLFLSMLLSSAAVMAQYVEGPYVGVGLGHVQHKVEHQSKLIGNHSADLGKFAAKAYVGYQFDESVAAELGYHYLGKKTYGYNTTVGQFIGNAHADYRADLFTLAFRGILPLSDDVSLQGKIGAGLYHAKGSANVQLVKEVEIGSVSKTKAVPVVGLGLGYKIDQTWSLLAEVEYFGKPSLSDNVKVDHIWSSTVGIRANFR